MLHNFIFNGSLVSNTRKFVNGGVLSSDDKKNISEFIKTIENEVQSKNPIKKPIELFFGDSEVKYKLEWKQDEQDENMYSLRLLRFNDEFKKYVEEDSMRDSMFIIYDKLEDYRDNFYRYSKGGGLDVVEGWTDDEYDKGGDLSYKYEVRVVSYSPSPVGYSVTAKSFDDFESAKKYFELNAKKVAPYDAEKEYWGKTIGVNFYKIKGNRTSKVAYIYYDRLDKKMRSYKKFSEGGGLGDVYTLKDEEDTWYLTYIDSTHFFLSNTKEYKGSAYHIGQFRARPFYNEVLSWLKSHKGQMANGGGVGTHFVGLFNEQQLRNKEDRKAIDKAMEETGLKYIRSKVVKKGGKTMMEVYLADKYSKGGGLDVVEGWTDDEMSDEKALYAGNKFVKGGGVKGSAEIGVYEFWDAKLSEPFESIQSIGELRKATKDKGYYLKEVYDKSLAKGIGFLKEKKSSEKAIATFWIGKKPSEYSKGGGLDVVEGWTDAEKSDAEAQYVKGGGLEQKGKTDKAHDKVYKAKRVGYRYTDERAKKLGLSPNAKPTQEHIDKYLGNGVYKEDRANRSDKSRMKKLNRGGSAGNKSMMQKIQDEVKKLKAEAPNMFEKHTDFVKKAASNLKSKGEL
jgi:hypothetical protein